MQHIIVVDDHQEIRHLLSAHLGKGGYRVTTAHNASALRAILRQGVPDLIILDIMMPGEDGLSLCRSLRMETDIPVILLTAVAAESDRVTGLEAGADDYIVKPFGPPELLARVRAVLRRASSLPAARRPKGQCLRFAGWTFDAGKRELLDDAGLATPLSTAECRLLIVLLDHPRTVLTRDQLRELTVGRTSAAFDRSVDNQVSRLRKKIERDPRNPELIKTHWGGGYYFTAEVEPG